MCQDLTSRCPMSMCARMGQSEPSLLVLGAVGGAAFLQVLLGTTGTHAFVILCIRKGVMAKVL